MTDFAFGPEYTHDSAGCCGWPEGCTVISPTCLHMGGPHKRHLQGAGEVEAFGATTRYRLVGSDEVYYTFSAIAGSAAGVGGADPVPWVAEILVDGVWVAAPATREIPLA